MMTSSSRLSEMSGDSTRSNSSSVLVGASRSSSSSKLAEPVCFSSSTSCGQNSNLILTLPFCQPLAVNLKTSQGIPSSLNHAFLSEDHPCIPYSSCVLRASANSPTLNVRCPIKI